jgi:hypothetical protein
VLQGQRCRKNGAALRRLSEVGGRCSYFKWSRHCFPPVERSSFWIRGCGMRLLCCGLGGKWQWWEGAGTTHWVWEVTSAGEGQVQLYNRTDCTIVRNAGFLCNTSSRYGGLWEVPLSFLGREWQPRGWEGAGMTRGVWEGAGAGERQVHMCDRTDCIVARPLAL